LEFAGVAAGCAARWLFISGRICPATMFRPETGSIRAIEAGLSQYISDI